MFVALDALHFLRTKQTEALTTSAQLCHSLFAVSGDAWQSVKIKDVDERFVHFFFFVILLCVCIYFTVIWQRQRTETNDC